MNKRKGLLLNCSICTKKNRSEANQQTKVRQARIDRRCEHSEKSSVAFSRSIGVELDSEGSIM